jgi:squalene-hopene/tetraprenyl-beta-curcumene cyclase
MIQNKQISELSVKSLLIYQKYIDNLILSDEIKKLISYDGVEHADFNLFYPHLFKGAFKINCPEKINSLSIAGYLYFKSILYADKIMDSQVKDEIINQYYFLSMICQEEAIKILASVFPLNSNFWALWNKRKGEYLSAYKNNRIDCSNNFPDGEISFFYDLADNKSAFGKVAIDCLLVLSDGDVNLEVYKKLTQSHRHFSIGRQLHDDICDLKEDFINNQTNYALYALQKACLHEGINFESLNDTELEKYMYVLGVADELLSLAITHFEISIKISKSCLSDLQNWIDINNIYIEIVKKFQTNQANYLKEIRAKMKIISDN